MAKGEKAPRSASVGKSKAESAFASLYNVFAEKKLKQYKLKFPKLRQSDLVSKILKEWQALDTKAKLDLQKAAILKEEKTDKYFKSLYDAYQEQNMAKYKQKFPKLGAEQLVKKIKQGWTNLDNQQKNALEKVYTTKGFLKKKITPSSGSNSSRKHILSKEKASELKMSSGKSLDISVQKQKSKAKPGKKTGIKAVKEQQSDKSKNGSEYAKEGSRSPGSKKKSSGSNKEGEPRVTKVINYDNLRNGAYIQFFKYYYARLSDQHKKWTPVQISSIIKLLWRKRSKKDKKTKLIKKELKEKPVSGRIAFKRAKLSERVRSEEIQPRWKQLPRESKIEWDKKGNNWRSFKKDKKQAHKQTKSVINSGKQHETMDVQTLAPLNFMDNRIQD